MKETPNQKLIKWFENSEGFFAQWQGKKSEAGPSANLPAPSPVVPGKAIWLSHPCEAGKRAHGHPHITPDTSLDAPVPDEGHLGRTGGLARRKPLLLFRLSGLFLLRFAERTLLGLLFHEPPRNTRSPPYGPFPTFPPAQKPMQTKDTH